MSGNSSAQKIGLNAIYGFVGWVLPMLVSFSATKILVENLGAEQYGVYAIVFSFVGYSFNFNLSRAVTKYTAEYYPLGEHRKVSEIFTATFVVNLAAGLIGGALLAISAPYVVDNILKIQFSSRVEAVRGLYLSALIILFTILSQLWSAVLQGLHRFDLLSKITGVGGFLQLSGNIFVVVATGGGIVELFAWNLLVTVLTGLVCLVYARKNIPKILEFDTLSSGSFGIVIRYSFWIVLYQILSNISVLYERTLITNRFGSESLTYYVVPMTLSFQIILFISSFAQVLFPLAGELSGDREKLRRIYENATKFTTVIVVFMVTTLLVTGESFLVLWLGAEFAEQATQLLILHVLCSALIAIAGASWQMTEGLGYPNINCLIYLLSLFVGFPLIWLLGQKFGNTGVAAGRLAGFSVVFAAVFFAEKFIFGELLVRFWLNLLSKVIFVALLTGVAETVLLRQFENHYYILAIVTVFGAAVYAAGLFATRLFGKEEILLFGKIVKFKS